MRASVARQAEGQSAEQGASRSAESAHGDQDGGSKTSGSPIEVTASVFSACAILKKVPLSALSAATGVPLEGLQAFMKGRVNLRADQKRLLADTLGIDLVSVRLKSDRVHFLHLDAMGQFTSQETFAKTVRAIGVLLLDSRAAALSFPVLGLQSKLGMVRPVHVVQNSSSRAIFLGARRLSGAKFDVSLVPGCVWARKTEANSVAGVVQLELAQCILGADLAAFEFDEIFRGARALTWGDVKNSARVHGVSKEELVSWIEAVGAGADKAASPGRNTTAAAQPGAPLDADARVSSGRIVRFPGVTRDKAPDHSGAVH